MEGAGRGRAYKLEKKQVLKTILYFFHTRSYTPCVCGGSVLDLVCKFSNFFLSFYATLVSLIAYFIHHFKKSFFMKKNLGFRSV